MQKTTIAAIMAALGIITVQLGFFFDEDPSTVTNWNLIVQAVGGILAAIGIFGTGLFARDNKVSDEQAGAGRTDYED